MCANYTPARQAAWDRAIKAVYPLGEFNPEAFPGHVAPIRTNEPRDDGVLATFGLLPHWARPELVRSTYNARSETAASKPSFRNAWKKGQFCIIPADGIFEPCYDSGRAVRWRITHRDGAPLGIAGLWESRPVGDSVQYSFSMLTISAAGHTIMQHMHKPEDEKRMVVILDPDGYADWLATPPQRALGWLRQYPAEWLSAEPAPRDGAAQLALI